MAPFRVSSDSPLRRHPIALSEKQITLLDGIRYSADMAGIAHDRLWRKLCEIDRNEDNASSADIAEAMLDAWSIIDACHRLNDLISELPGLKHEPWLRLLQERMKIACKFRDMWQHHASEVTNTVAQRGQAWGSLAWHQHADNGRPTGRWFLAVAGTEFKGSRWIFAGPAHAIDRVDSRRIRLLHSEGELYLSRAVSDVFEAISHLENAISSGKLRLVGDAVNRERSNDFVMHSSIEVLYRMETAQETNIGLPSDRNTAT